MLQAEIIDHRAVRRCWRHCRAGCTHEPWLIDCLAPAARGPPSEVCGSRTQIHSFDKLHVAIGAFGGASILTGWRTLRH